MNPTTPPDPPVTAEVIGRFFSPDGKRAQAMDATMHAELAGSIAYLAQQCEGHVQFDRVAASRLVIELRQGVRYPPEAFARYYALAFGLLEEDTDRASRCWHDLLAVAPAGSGLQVQPLADPTHSALGALYAGMMGSEGESGVVIRPPTPEIATAFRRRFDEGLALMEKVFPDLAAEFCGIIREVICVVGDPARRMQFDGGSHFQLWGALFINAEFHPTPAAMMEVLAHESAHSLLFGFCTHEPVVHNEDNEVFPSPLRVDLRPMDGIYHATFVSARMHLAMSRLLASGLVPQEERNSVIDAIEADRRHFRSGDEVVRAHGILSPLGRELMDNARSYMDAATAP